MFLIFIKTLLFSLCVQAIFLNFSSCYTIILSLQKSQSEGENQEGSFFQGAKVPNISIYKSIIGGAGVNLKPNNG